LKTAGDVNLTIYKEERTFSQIINLQLKMSIPTETKVYVLANPPTGAIKPDTFKLETQSLPKESELKDGELLFKTVALSNDPAQRTWMTKDVDAVSPLVEKVRWS